MKDVARYIPGIGWMFMFMEYPIVKRNWEQDQERLAKSCQELADYPINMLVSYLGRDGERGREGEGGRERRREGGRERERGRGRIEREGRERRRGEIIPG